MSEVFFYFFALTSCIIILLPKFLVNKMKMIVLAVSYIICSSFFINNENTNLENFHLFTGKWVSSENNSTTIEVWKKVSEHSLEGYGKTINDSDSTLKNYESLRILEMSQEIFYLAKVEHNDLPIPFKLTQSSKNNFVFENPGHDFPNRIEYNFLNETKLEVIVGSKEKLFKINFEKNIK